MQFFRALLISFSTTHGLLTYSGVRITDCLMSPSQSSISRINELHESISAKGSDVSFFDYAKALVIDIPNDTGYNNVTPGLGAKRLVVTNNEE
uniref:Uncharacterized protein n=1 Tax=Candidatus Methanogaster sp. ANME-2c ERB4 TaxID=2759911 RepID=A0A7G9YNS7_9EURY|nr:hypothetical protein FBMMOPGC_00008 [Methanosarcinales archaeon ANME-2c ERB4]QNO50106.1 hypothetical protein GDOAKEED_00010 [Methanosarcinales archaeon ANME-2c ERB4]